MLNKAVITALTTLFISASISNASEQTSEYLAGESEQDSLEREKRFAGTSIVVKRGIYPWIVKIEDADSKFTGFLITKRHVLTAAHPLKRYTDDGKCLKVHFNNADSPHKAEFRAKRFVLHPGYDDRNKITEVNDIAVIELEGSMVAGYFHHSMLELDTKGYSCAQVSPESELRPRVAGYAADAQELLNMRLSWEYGSVIEQGDCKLDSDGQRTPNLFTLSSAKRYYENPGKMEVGDAGSPLFLKVKTKAGGKKNRIIGIASQGREIMNFEPVYKHKEFIDQATGSTSDEEDERQKLPWRDVQCET